MNNTINCNLVLFPRFHDGWVVFDRWFYGNENGKVIHKIIYDENANKPKRMFPSFNFQHALDYLLSADKKAFRKKSDFFDSEISGSEYNKRITHLAQHSKSVYRVHNVKFIGSLFICPISGVVWKKNEICFQKPCPFGKKFLTKNPWKLSTFKYGCYTEILFAPDSLLEILAHNRCPVDKGPKGVKLWDYEFVSYDETTEMPIYEKVASTTAEYGYLSGLYDFGWGKYTGYRKKNYLGNPRTFIWHLFNKQYALQVDKEDIIKSAARYIKKITRIAPLSESTKKFFKTLGALAHLKKAATYATQP